MCLCIHLHRRTIVLLLLSVLLSTISSSNVRQDWPGSCRIALRSSFGDLSTINFEVARELRENMPVQHFLDAIRHNTDPAFTRR